MHQAYVRMAFRHARISDIGVMQQASNISRSSYAAARRIAQIIVVMLALAVMVVASCMMVAAQDKPAVFSQSDQGQGVHDPTARVPEPAT